MSYDIEQVLSSTKFDLNQIIKNLVGKGCPYEGNQKELAKLVGIDATQISRLYGGGMPELRDHWKFSLRLFFLCMELNLITDHDLQGLKTHANQQNPDHAKTRKTASSSRK